MPQPNDQQLFAVILGTNEIASAIGVQLAHLGYCVVLSHDPDPPVIRRKMAFHDALFADTAQVEDVIAERVDDGLQVYQALRQPSRVLVTWLGLLDLLPVRQIDVLIDARLQKRRITPDLRRLARLSIGLGPGFSSNFNCDVAVETRPGKIGLVTDQHWTDAADNVASSLGDVGAERFVYSPFAGRWHTPIEIGTRVYKISCLVTSPAFRWSHRATASCAASRVTAAKFRPASSCWRSIRADATPSGPE